MSKIKVINQVKALYSGPVEYEQLRFTCRGEVYYLPSPIHQFRMRSEGSMILDGLKTTDWVHYR